MSNVNVQPTEVRLPDGFYEKNGCLFFHDEIGDKDILVSTQSLVPVVKACNKNLNANWHIMLRCINHSGAEVEMNICLKQAKMNIDPVISHLAGSGVFIQNKKYLMIFLEASCGLNLPVYRVATQAGFQTDGELIFMHGSIPVFAPEHLDFKGVIPAENMLVNTSVAVTGSLEEWKHLVAGKVQGFAPKLAVLVGLSSPLLPLINEGGGMFHLAGHSSTGKTVAMQLCASVNGPAAEPGSGAPTGIRRWNTTSNGLETLMASSNNTTLCIDELGSFAGKNFAHVLYDTVSGQSKTRMNGESFDKAAESTWSQNVLSTGELTIEERLRQDKEHILDGQMHRSLSIPITAEDSRGEGESAEAARQRISEIKKNLLSYYGSAGCDFVHCLTGLRDDSGNNSDWQGTATCMRNLYLLQCDEIMQRLRESRIELTDVEKRASERFGVLYLAGMLAVEWDILPWSRSDVSDVVFQALTRWLNNYRHDANRKANILSEVQNYLGSHGAKFYDARIPYPGVIKADIAGYCLKDGCYLILPGAFEKLGEKWGLNTKKLAQLIDSEGYLIRPEGDRLTMRKTINKVNITGYCISGEFTKAEF
ncbi:DUF927 domain-containing protein [Citrobacter portucalensis]|nr:DUF927 domain-containing protein [Citrobacter portucalensis]MDN4360181.1 DUF927 domain-containing protein [Citrobacter portucalensis]MDN4365671.1 DUF927 domain-containing protein [Citrobacter portucalensis]MDN4376371.1 DUF927 domain-containing protein [Citrobacter portucalensis]MDN4381263.1 DUF927 domain-containing protein [Citrobacter portucalensis]MDN4391324.1 DUF927 domain-containing protein [Citrobacter portucalensis]